MVNSRAKGKRGELEWRDVLRAAGYHGARRGQQFSGTETSEDVVGGPQGFHCEVKVRERHDMWAAIEQARRDSEGAGVPYVAAKATRKPWLVVMRAEDWLALVARAAAPTPSGSCVVGLEGQAAHLVLESDEDGS